LKNSFFSIFLSFKSVFKSRDTFWPSFNSWTDVWGSGIFKGLIIWLGPGSWIKIAQTSAENSLYLSTPPPCYISSMSYVSAFVKEARDGVDFNIKEARDGVDFNRTVSLFTQDSVLF